ncbi:unnamed protein product [Rotaria socialis]|uniref:SH2 domain-containing protein n=1 Tax=Rotaria socialis TaxID=392032 RepID=A0A818P2S9_9BILA|nr:unnamed protein product [Rotaria socialis]CAF3613829.1 unnamed protein product [Rotaria socialis]CAF4487848.1 unnamed protein product [Rotaria socialis]CAF4552407.1 unnamed protein product [Rotaria socialis]
MKKIDGFQKTDSFRYDRNSSASTISLSSSSGYGSRLSLSHAAPSSSSSSSSSSSRRISITKYIKEKLSRHKSLASLVLSSSRTEMNNPNTDIYDHVWNLEEQIEKVRLTINKQLQFDAQSVISMSVDAPQPRCHRIDDQNILSAAAWYQEGLSEDICVEYLNYDEKSIGSFFIRCNYNHSDSPYILSIKTTRTSIEHFFIQQTFDNHTYRIQGSLKTFANLSTLVIHHTVMRENLPVALVLPLTYSTLNSPQHSSSLGIIRSVRF